MTTRVTIKLVTDSDTPTPNNISNAVRRALTQQNLKDMPLTPGHNDALDTKGVTLKVRAVTGKQPNYKPKNPEIVAIREFARANGIKVGARGRISATIREQYAASIS